ncbi:MAG TPA: aminotransferase class V-fold PLP-dependent enzyme [Candidatus Sulfomarinibacteraceae bacterium]|nr:aminotransferase class V-fold PLP-dependent enzyme [Candidatus Sulfomarinibacteraceae bacterium]
MYDVQKLRRDEFPLSEAYLYFNHASISPLPVRTRERMTVAVQRLAEHPMKFFAEVLMPLTERLTGDIASYINAASAEEIVPVSSTSAGLSAVARAIDWQPGDNVLFCEIEFPSNAYPWLSLEREGVEVRQVPAVAGGLTLDALAPLVDERTRLVAASAIQFFSGHRTNLAAVGAFCDARDILFVVDAIQAIGHMAIDVKAMHIDALASGGQKSLLAAPGIGCLYVRNDLCSQLQPAPIGPNATQDFMHWLDYDLTPRPGAARFAMGTWDVVGWYGLASSLELLQELGVENIDRHTSTLAAEAIAMLQRQGFEVLTPAGHGPIVTFRSGLSSEQTDEVVARLDEEGVSVVKHLDAAGEPHIRLSFHAYNTSDELHRFERIFNDAYEEVRTES